MASGDAGRVWFSEMIQHLRTHWRPGISFHALVSLRDDLDAILQRIRSERRIMPPAFRCPNCGGVGPGADPHVSVRAMILSLGRFGFATAEQTRALERAWARHRKEADSIPTARPAIRRTETQ